MAKNPCPRSLCNNEKFCTTVFVCSYGTQVDSFSKHKMVKNLVTLSLYGNKIHQKSAIFSTKDDKLRPNRVSRLAGRYPLILWWLFLPTMSCLYP